MSCWQVLQGSWSLESENTVLLAHRAQRPQNLNDHQHNLEVFVDVYLFRRGVFALIVVIKIVRLQIALAHQFLGGQPFSAADAVAPGLFDAASIGSKKSLAELSFFSLDFFHLTDIFGGQTFFETPLAEKWSHPPIKTVMGAGS
jgi:hypothetical protein